MALQPIDLRWGEALGIEAFIHIAVKQIHRLLGVLQAERRLPGRIALGVEAGDFVRHAHQRRQILRRQLAQLRHQDGRLLKQRGLAVFLGGRGGGFV